MVGRSGSGSGSGNCMATLAENLLIVLVVGMTYTKLYEYYFPVLVRMANRCYRRSCRFFNGIVSSSSTGTAGTAVVATSSERGEKVPGSGPSGRHTQTGVGIGQSVASSSAAAIGVMGGYHDHEGYLDHPEIENTRILKDLFSGLVVFSFLIYIQNMHSLTYTYMRFS